VESGAKSKAVSGLSTFETAAAVLTGHAATAPQAGRAARTCTVGDDWSDSVYLVLSRPAEP